MRAKLVSCLVVLLFAGSASAELMGYWKLDEGAGTTTRDSSGKGNHGTLIGAPQWVVGYFRGALQFNGQNSYVEIPNSPSLEIRGKVTVAAWVNWTDAGDAWLAILANGQQNGPWENYGLFVNRSSRFAYFTLSLNDAHVNQQTPNNTVEPGRWQHLCGTWDGTSARIYVDGKLLLTQARTGTLTSARMPLRLGHRNGSPHYYSGLMDEVAVFDQALTQAEIQTVMLGIAPAELAADPSPADGAVDVPRDATVGWTPGKLAATHDVYFGTAFADVNTASRIDKKGVLASQGQADATFDPPGSLTYGQTYYWRIDEVNKAPDNTIFKGEVWSFTAEPYSYPVKPVAAKASSSQVGMGPEKTMDGSGLTGDLHGTEPTTMWLSVGGQPNWIQYEFDKTYKLHQLMVWNSNQLIEAFLGFGARKVTVETSIDGTTWTPLANVPEFSRAPGAPGYAANTTVSFGGVEAKFVKLTINTNWGGMAPSTGLAEVRFSYVPVQAHAPQPATATTGISVDANLSWRPGREAASHQVFFGVDQAAVAGGTAPAKTVTDHAYVANALALGTTYYWRVDEVNAAVTYPGDVWSFTTQSYKVVDDFESYTDKAGAEVFSIWIDGFADSYKSSGSTVGLDTAKNGTFGETTILHGGKQSMPMAYDNAKAPISEATRTFDPPQDWTTNGIKSLSLWFQGVAGNGGQLYVKINGTKIAYEGDAADLARATWHVWNVDLSKAGKVNSVRTLTIGIEGAGVKGTLYIDDIRLYATLPAPIAPADPGTKGLVAYYKLDGDTKDSAGSHHGTLTGAPSFAAGKVGQAFNVVGDAMYITVPYAADLGMNSYTVSVWVNYTDKNGNRGILGTRFNGENTFDLKVDATRIHADIGSGTAWLNNAVDVVAAQGGAITTGVWHHILYAVEPGVTRIYLDGALASTVTYTGTPLFMKSGQELRLGCSYGTEYMRGAIDEVRLYNRALSAAEAAALAGRPGPVFQAP